MHPTISYEVVKADIADLRHQAQRGARARAARRARRARRTPARPGAGDAKCQALFASTLQPSDAPGADVVAEAISVTVQQIGAGGCTGRVAQEFGEHPEAATERMRWVRSLLGCA
jgi:hypothetical protein